MENFSTHSRTGYYDGLIFHRVIRSFMVQTGERVFSATAGYHVSRFKLDHKSILAAHAFSITDAHPSPAGDPNGDGTGGTSIWGAEFEDEIDRNVRFDRPGLLAMVSGDWKLFGVGEATYTGRFLNID